MNTQLQLQVQVQVQVQVNDSGSTYGLTYSPELMRIMREISDLKKQS